ncbi:helix-turn-helix domain-containing protein [Aestuariibaculum suncheonense]|uniref:Helix-turn-helix domain-containing protein n=1 Tax=Aestuariibaculum suncheonense TaxID=1028745 RepID=A0A8J6QET2_9FLAO|nr:helix-turn-helix domain-containing protein [Aestuariibaculum suncheonense]MBD0834456.1 helix-turn-helix domain-containing protein [Aestuariibaculum suncheonense]
MKSNSIILENLSIEELQELIGSTVKKSVTELQQELESTKFTEELLTREETCKFLRVDSSTLWAWTNKGKVKAYGIGARRYYKRSELLESLTLLKK